MNCSSKNAQIDSMQFVNKSFRLNLNWFNLFTYSEFASLEIVIALVRRVKINLHNPMTIQCAIFM